MKSIFVNIVLGVVLLAMCKLLYDSHVQMQQLKDTLEQTRALIKTMDANAVEFRDIMLKAPKASKQMENIAAKKPKLLEKRINDGFKTLTDDISEATK